MNFLKKAVKAVSKPFHSNTMKSVLPVALATAGTYFGGPVGGAAGGALGSALTGGNTAENIGAAAGGYVAGIGAYAGQKMARNLFSNAYPSVGDEADTAIDTLSAEAEETKKRRRALYATSGGSNGEEVEAVGVFANGRGSIFGN